MKTIQNKNILLALSLGGLLAMTGAGCNNTPAAVGPIGGVTPAIFVQSLVSLGQSGQINSAYANSKLLKVDTDSPSVNGYPPIEDVVFYDGLTQTDVVINTNNNVFSATTGATPSLNGVSDAEYFAKATYNGTLGLATVSPGTDASGNPVYTSGTGVVYSQSDSTRDTDLQQDQLQQTSQQTRAAQLASTLQMSYSSALQITLLADTIQLVKTNKTQLTDDDQSAIMQRLQGIAGVSQDELNAAMQSAVQGDMTATNTMLEKISTNLGMPSGSLRNKILPQMGINLSN